MTSGDAQPMLRAVVASVIRYWTIMLSTVRAVLRDQQLKGLLTASEVSDGTYVISGVSPLARRELLG